MIDRVSFPERCLRPGRSGRGPREQRLRTLGEVPSPEQGLRVSGGPGGGGGSGFGGPRRGGELARATGSGPLGRGGRRRKPDPSAPGAAGRRRGLEPELPAAPGLCRKCRIGGRGSAPAPLFIPSHLCFIELDRSQTVSSNHSLGTLTLLSSVCSGCSASCFWVSVPLFVVLPASFTVVFLSVQSLGCVLILELRFFVTQPMEDVSSYRVGGMIAGKKEADGKVCQFAVSVPPGWCRASVA